MDVSFVMGRQEQERLSQWLERNQTISIEVSFLDCYLLFIKKWTRDTSIRSKSPSPIWKCITRLWSISSMRITMPSSISSRIKRVMYWLRVSQGGKRITKNKLYRFYSKARTTKQSHSTSSIKIVLVRILSLLSTLKSEAKLRVARRWSWVKSILLIWLVHKELRRQDLKVELL